MAEKKSAHLKYSFHRGFRVTLDNSSSDRIKVDSCPKFQPEAVRHIEGLAEELEMAWKQDLEPENQIEEWEEVSPVQSDVENAIADVDLEEIVVDNAQDANDDQPSSQEIEENHQSTESEDLTEVSDS